MKSFNTLFAEKVTKYEALSVFRRIWKKLDFYKIENRETTLWSLQNLILDVTVIYSRMKLIAQSISWHVALHLRRKRFLLVSIPSS